jgi:hypothetical protein
MSNIERRRATLDEAYEEIGDLISEAGGHGDEAFDVIKGEVSLLRDELREATGAVRASRDLLHDATKGGGLDGAWLIAAEAWLTAHPGGQ